MTWGTVCWIAALLIAGVLEVYWRRRAWRAEAQLGEERRRYRSAAELIDEQRECLNKAMRALHAARAEAEALRKQTFH